MAIERAPFFSVVIPVYNRAGTLRVALRSVLAQSEQDFEIVVVDDGSTDDPKATVEAFGDPRIRYIRRENGGGGAARNTGIAQAAGDFIAFLDSDDVFLPHHLRAMRQLLAGTEKTVGYARVVVYRGEGNTFLKPPRAIAKDEDMASYLLADRGFVATTTTVVPAALARKIGYHMDLREAEDTDFAVRLALEGCSFAMADAPGAIWNDYFDPNRLSAGRCSQRMAQWLDAMRTRIPRAAYLGGMGWAVAKGVALTHPLRALRLYLQRAAPWLLRPGPCRGRLPPDRPARPVYRAVADGAIGWLRVGLRPAKKTSARSVATERTC